MKVSWLGLMNLKHRRELRYSVFCPAYDNISRKWSSSNSKFYVSKTNHSGTQDSVFSVSIIKEYILFKPPNWLGILLEQPKLKR